MRNGSDLISSLFSNFLDFSQNVFNTFMSSLVSLSRADSGSFSTVSSGSIAMGRGVLDQICETQAGHSHCEDSGAYILQVLCNYIIKVAMVNCEMVVLSGNGGQHVLVVMMVVGTESIMG